QMLFYSSRRRHTRSYGDWSSDVCLPISYAIAGADFHANKLEVSVRGTCFQLITPDDVIPLSSPLIGRVNVYNILAATAAAYARGDRKSTRLNSSHRTISYAVFCLKKKKK